VLDGEIVCRDADGKPQFRRLLFRATSSKGTTSDYFQLVVRRWHREGLISAGYVFW